MEVEGVKVGDPVDTVCPSCKHTWIRSWDGKESVACPSCKHTFCGRPTEVYSRIVGYHRPIKNWNKGKLAEFKDRKTYKVK